ncbi:MAG: hypothetical protein WB987_00345 [Candidatus Acidiferrales bacterium]
MKMCALWLAGTLFLAQGTVGGQKTAAESSSGAAPAAAAADPAETPADGMAEFRYFVGSWQPVSDAGAAPAKYSETYTFAPILDGGFVMSQEIYRDASGKIVYRDFAVFGVDPDTHKLFLHAYNTDGSIDRTRAIASASGEWVFLGTVYGSKRFRDYRYTLTKNDENHMQVLIELLKDGKYEKLSETHYERKSNDVRPEVQ